MHCCFNVNEETSIVNMRLVCTEKIRTLVRVDLYGYHAVGGKFAESERFDCSTTIIATDFLTVCL